MNPGTATAVAAVASAGVSPEVAALLTQPIPGPADFGARMSGRRYNVWKRKKLNRIKACNGGILPKKWRTA